MALNSALVLVSVTNNKNVFELNISNVNNLKIFLKSSILMRGSDLIFLL
jgi:hypothetical protein